MEWYNERYMKRITDADHRRVINKINRKLESNIFAERQKRADRHLQEVERLKYKKELHERYLADKNGL